MKRKVKLAFAQLENELQVITSLDSRNYLGGSYPPFIMLPEHWAAILSGLNAQYSAYFHLSGNSSGFSLSSGNSSGVQQAKYNGTNISGTVGMNSSGQAELTITSGFITAFASGSIVPGYQTASSGFTVYRPEWANTPYQSGIRITF